MRVVALSGVSRTSGGLFYAARSLCRSLAECGVELSVYGREDLSARNDLAAWHPVSVKAFKAYGPLGYSPKMRHALTDNCDLIHLHGIWMDDQWAAIRWQKKYNKPVVISPHGMLDPWAVKNSAWKKKLVGALFANESLKKASCIHALCDSEAESIRAYGVKAPIAVIPNGVELPDPGSSSAVTRDRKRLLFLGRIHPKKGLDELVKGWAKAGLKGWELLIAGWDDGGHEAGLKKRAEDLGVANSVSFIGSRFGAEKEVLLRSVDAFVLPSFSEGLPMSVLEAWSYGLPVVMTDFCNIPSGFEEEAAIRIEPESDSIFQGLEQLSGMSRAECLAMGSRGRKLVEDRFVWAKIAEEMKRVYAWSLGGDKPACIRDI